MPKIEKDLLKVKGSDGQWHYIPAVGGGVTPTWDAVQDKPFESLGDGLEVDENGVLSAKGGTGGSANAVQYVEQMLTDEQKAQARENIEAPARALYAPIESDKGNYYFSSSIRYNELREAYNEGVAVYLAHGSPWAYIVPLLSVIDGKMIFAYFDTVQFYAIKYTVSSDSSISVTFDRVARNDAIVLRNQGAGNAGKILGIGEDGIVVPQDKPSGGSVTVDDALSSTSENPVQNKIITAALAEKITAPTTAAVGQIIKVKSVDSTGKPMEWECADLPSGGGGETWEKLVDTTLAEAVESVTYTFDNCKRIKALIAPAIANGEFVSGWTRITINNVAYPSFNGKVNSYEGIGFEIDSEYPPYVQGDINTITNTTIYGILGGKHAASLENIAPNGVTEFGCQTAALLKAGTKIEIWGVKS